MTKTIATSTRRKFAAWPGWPHLLAAGLLAAFVTLWFGFIYGTADYVTALRSDRIPVHLDAELKIPFVPAAVVLYMSIYLLFWISPFVLRSQRELRALAVSLGLVTLIGGIGFLLIPADLAYTPPPSIPAPWEKLFALADALNLQYNLVPSLHVALTVLCIDVYSRHAKIIAQVLLWSWGSAIALSTVLTHQHHLLDVATGICLALAVSRVIYPRFAGSNPASAET